MYNYRAERSIRSLDWPRIPVLARIFKLLLTVKLPRLCVEAGLEVGGGGGQGLAEAVSGQGHQLGLHVWGAARHTAGADLQVDS